MTRELVSSHETALATTGQKGKNLKLKLKQMLDRKDGRFKTKNIY